MSGQGQRRTATVWRIEPGRGVGPLRIGMPVDAAIGVLEAAGLGPVERSTKASAPVYAGPRWSVLLYPGPSLPEGPQPLAEVELTPPARLDLLGRPLLGEPLAEAERFLRSVDARTERRADLVEAPGLGIRVWSGGEPPDRLVSSVTVGAPKPPALVLDPGFAFPELDLVLRALGFDGGPTTVGAPLLAGEPEVAEWTRRHVLIRYTFDPVSFLRVLLLGGGEADRVPVVRKVVARVPSMGLERVLADLGAPDDVTRLRAIQAVSVLRLAQARDRLGRISAEGPPILRAAAARALAGLPDPPGSAASSDAMTS